MKFSTGSFRIDAKTTGAVQIAFVHGSLVRLKSNADLKGGQVITDLSLGKRSQLKFASVHILSEDAEGLCLCKAIRA
jgi:hypothetical protein